MDAISWGEGIERLGIIGILAAIIWSGVRQMWVFGWTYRQAIKERDEWKSLAIDQLDLGRQAINTASKVASDRK